MSADCCQSDATPCVTFCTFSQPYPSVLPVITVAELPVLSYQSLALKHTYEVYFGYDRTLRKYGRFRQKLPVKTDFRKNSARRRPVTGRSPRTGEEAQCICSYSEQVRPEALISGCVCCFPGMIYPHIRRLDPVNRSMNDQQRIH